MDTLDQILENLWSSDYVQSNPNKAYKTQYNAEYLAIAKYMTDGTRPDPATFSKMGKVLVGLEDHIRAEEPDPDPDPTPSAIRFFADSSPWNTKVPTNPQLHPNSAQYVSTLYSKAQGINVNQGSWTPNVFVAKQTDPTQTMVNQDGWTLDNVPIPANLKPSGDSDAHAVILCPWKNIAYDFFSLKKDSSGKWTMHSGVIFRLDGSGWWDGTTPGGPWAARASGASLLGMIRPEDVAAGRIPHALSMACPKDANGTGSVTPAKTSDGIGGSGAAPMGSHYWLPHSVDINSLGLEEGDKLIAKALQEYGAFSTDSTNSGSACAIYCQSFATMPSNPYPGSWANGLPRSLIQKLVVLQPPPAPVYDSRLVFGQPHK